MHKLPDPVMCLGCSRKFVPTRVTAKPVCRSCKSNEARYRRAMRRHEEALVREAIDKVAEQETQTLKRKDTFTPIMGERIIAMMQRG